MSERIVPQDFYVYVHRKATTGEVFYVGKGRGDRCFKLTGKNRSKLWHKVAKKHGCIVEIVQDGLQEWAALEMEVGLIAMYGRMNEGAGALCNLSDGGDSGFAGGTHGDEARAKISQRHKGVKKTLEHRQKLKSPKTEACKAKLSAQKMGRQNPMFGRTGEKHPNFGVAMRKKAVALKFENGEVMQFETIKSAAAYIAMDSSAMVAILNGRRKIAPKYRHIEITRMTAPERSF
jgi:hypothetical protein